MMTLAKNTAAIASSTRPIRLLLARICSGVRLSCELRVMLEFLNTLLLPLPRFRRRPVRATMQSRRHGTGYFA